MEVTTLGEDGRSERRTLKSRGEIMEPCGTPDTIGQDWEIDEDTDTENERSVRKAETQRRRRPEIPCEASLYRIPR